MKDSYSDELTTLLERARPTLATTHRLEFKNVFGAVGGFVDGNIFISYGRFGVALRLPPGVLDSLFQEKDVTHLKYFPNGHVKKKYAVLPKRILESEEQFETLLGKSIAYAGRDRC